MQKIYAYVDEAGQHTKGKLFVVSVVITEAQKREELATILQRIEALSGKRGQKWRTSKHEERFAYLTAVLSNTAFKGRLLFARYTDTKAYVDLTVKTTAAAITNSVVGEYKATVLVDGLRGSERDSFAVALRKRGIRTEKVRGVDDKKDMFIRLADALCGCLVDAQEGGVDYRRLLQKAQTEDMLIHLP
jgi:hypothetical protein